MVESVGLYHYNKESSTLSRLGHSIKYDLWLGFIPFRYADHVLDPTISFKLETGNNIDGLE